MHTPIRTLMYALTVSLLLLLVACSKDPPKTAVDDLPPGDVDNGAVLFNQQIAGNQSCVSCHALNAARGAGPGMEGYAERAATEVDGESAEVYSYWSILRPSRHLVRGYSNVMPSNYEDTLDDQQVADLIAFMLTQ